METTGGAGNIDILQQLLHGTDSKVASLEFKAKQETDLQQKFADLEQEVATEVVKNKGRRAQIREKVLRASLDELERDTKQEEEDFALAVLGVQTLMSQIDKTYDELQTFSPEERAMIDQAQQELQVAEAQREAAKGKWF